MHFSVKEGKPAGNDSLWVSSLTDQVGSRFVLGMERLLPDIYPMHAHVQHYAWGDPIAIPHMLQQANPSGKPFAEYWMGAHPDLPCEVKLEEGSIALDELIARQPEMVLGKRVATTFGHRLPFLFKLLAAAEPLSIQVHPSKSSAEKGFLLENEAGIPLKASHRNFKDDNHKPELMMALEPFYGLRGFRPFKEIKDVLDSVPEFRPLSQRFSCDTESLRAVYGIFMRMDDEAVHDMLHPVLQRLSARHQSHPFSKSDREYWLLRSDACFARNGRHDRGLFSIFLLNLVCLQPGQAMYLPAGILHAYLEGVGMELMANSNNVLRGGLTPKHVDVDELIKEVVFKGERIDIIHAEPDSQWASMGRYATTAREFELQRLDATDASPTLSLTADGPEILFPPRATFEKQILIRSNRRSIRLTQPKPVLVCCGVEYQVELPQGCTLFRAVVPSLL